MYLLYFIAGVLQDFLFTLSLRFVNKNNPYKAGSTAFLETVITLTILYQILNNLEGSKTILAIFIYAFGIGTGTIVAMKLKLK